MRICLVISPPNEQGKIPERVYGCTFSVYKQPELPLLYAAAVLKQDGHEVALKDFTEAASPEPFEAYVDRAAHDVYIFHTVLLSETPDRKAARYILDHSKAKVLFFGPHPTLKPADFLIDSRCYVVRGEAEFILRDLLRDLDNSDISRIKGISYLDQGEMVETPTYGIIQDIDDLPFPVRSLLPGKDDYFNPKLEARPVTLILTSRGCSFRCYYCVPNAISWARELEWKRFNGGKKPPVTMRSPRSIAEEFRLIKSEGYRAVSIIDDMFLFGGKKRVLELCRELEQVGLPFGGLARCDLLLDEETVAALARAGCRYIDLGIESLDQKILEDIRKDMDMAKVRRAIELLVKYGIEPKANIMFGASPLETKESITRTVSEISGYPINYCMFLIATPFPGTEFSEKALKNRWALEPEIHDLEKNLSPTDKSLIEYPHLRKEELEAAVRRANRLFYLHPKRIWYQLRKLRSLKALKDLIATGWKVVK